MHFVKDVCIAWRCSGREPRNLGLPLCSPYCREPRNLGLSLRSPYGREPRCARFRESGNCGHKGS